MLYYYHYQPGSNNIIVYNIWQTHHARLHPPTAVQVVAVRWVGVRPTMMNAPFLTVPLAMNGRSVLHSNKQSRMRRDILDSFWCFLRIKKILGRTETLTRYRMCFQSKRSVWDSNSWQDVLSVDTNSLRHLPRRSSKNCDLQFANFDRQN